MDFIKDFTANRGIMVDPVYTGKMMYAIYDLVKQNTFKTGSSILALHTGGLVGILGMKDKF